MRILTPSEQREVERIKSKMATGEISIDLYTEQDDLAVTTLNRELWLNILDLALQQNDAMRESWRSNPTPNWTDEVVDRLRPNG